MKVIDKICENCEFYDVVRFDSSPGRCVLDHHTTQESIIVQRTDTCDQWFPRSEDD